MDVSNLVWAAEHDYQILDTRFRVQSSRRDDADEVARLLAPFAVDGNGEVESRLTFSLLRGDQVGPAETDTCIALCDGRRLAARSDVEDQLIAISTMMNQLAIAECTAFATHAGVVAIDGAGVAFPAESGGGKTTLTAACLAKGFAYGSDEALVVSEESGMVIRYPKPLALTQWSRSQLNLSSLADAPDGPDAGEHLFVASDFGADLTDPEFRLEHVVLSEYGHDTATLEQAPGRDAMTALLRLSFNHFKHGERAFRLAADLANHVSTWRLRYGDPLSAADLLRRELTR